MNHFRAILFDLDGTLIDHFATIHRCHAFTMKQFGLPLPTPAQVRRVVGRGFEQAIADLFGPEHKDQVPAAIPVYRDYWQKTLLDDVTLLPGAKELLTTLKSRGVKTAVLTNKHGPSAREICTHLGLDPLLDGVFGAFDTPWLKPQPEFTRHALTSLRAEAEATLLVGDSPYDVQTAHAAGFPCWCVITGTHNAGQLRACGADKVFANLHETSAQLLQ